MAEWATIAESEAYLLLKPNTEAWFATGLDQQVYLTTAYRSLFYDPDYTIPASPSTAQNTLLENAQIELAFYILSNPNSDKRQTLINQGVKQFKIGEWSESFDQTKGRDYEGYSKYPVVVADLIYSFLKVPQLSTNLKRAQEDII